MPAPAPPRVPSGGSVGRPHWAAARANEKAHAQRLAGSQNGNWINGQRYDCLPRACPAAQPGEEPHAMPTLKEHQLVVGSRQYRPKPRT